MNEKVFIIAEAGSNWRVGEEKSDIQQAKRLIEIASEAGADAVKFQTYRPETVYVSNAGSSDYLSKGGIDDDITSIFRHLSMPYEMIPLLAQYCQKCDIQFMSTPFSPADFAAIDPYVTTHKLASYEISHIHLIELMASSHKPLIMSTGAAELEDIQWAIDTFNSHGGKDLTLMQCTAQYPADLNAMNLKAITTLKDIFKLPVGLSDHSRDPIVAPIAAVTLGATVIEKHFTTSNKLHGPDHFSAIEPHELHNMVKAIRSATEILGDGKKHILPAEEELYNYARRGIQATKNILKGEEFCEGVNIDILRPGKQKLGIHPKYIKTIDGQPSLRNISLGEGVQNDDFEKPMTEK